jgi:two-component system OmpR family response regulator
VNRVTSRYADRVAAASGAARANRVLVIDEEAPLTHLLTLALTFEGWQVETLDAGERALEVVARFEPDAILLDMMLPDIGGVEVVTRLRAAGVTVPVIFLTGRSSLEDRIAAFTAGGDDYMTKPFGLEEVTGRLRAVFRRSGLAPTSRVFGDIVLDTHSAQVWRAGESLLVSPLEVRMLEVLIDREGEPLDGAAMVEALGLHGHTVIDSAAIRVLESLRAKVNEDAATVVVVRGGRAWLQHPRRPNAVGAE